MTVEERTIKTDRSEENETPLEDNCCKICFRSFIVPVGGIITVVVLHTRTCILQYWNCEAVSSPCKCPMCVCHITKLSPEATLQQRQEQELKGFSL
ncbi:unnamed protein product [Eruca vesicaria subsp. sativa]|uniref:Uncharacterized protein n=1 Tax=Eruca vesicaria subsp. sativa TaxID=29727 RepID=A0ABC8L901_ERUVS|nr:unnamed protein product [Eruca vesicaria subsp. sativa]